MKPIIGILPLFDEKKRVIYPIRSLYGVYNGIPSLCVQRKESQKIFEEFIRKCRE